jgi:hypothetical protein
MVMRHALALLVPALLLTAGCGGSGGTGGTGGSGGSGAGSAGWSAGAEGDLSLPPGAKGYGMFDGKKGEKVRVSANSDKGPVDLRLYLYVNGKETELGRKNQVKEATLEATVPADGSVTLQVSNEAKSDTSVRYKMERHAGK